MPTPVMQKGLWHGLRNSVCAKEKMFNNQCLHHSGHAAGDRHAALQRSP